MDQVPFNHTFFHIATVTPKWEPYDKDDKKSFPHPVHHQPIAVSLLRLKKASSKDANDKLEVTITSKGIHDIEEEGRALVAAFFQKVPGETSYLVSFGGRSFSLPVMVYNAMRYGVDASQYLRDQEVFTAQFSDQHTDLAELLSGYGAMYKAAKLHEYAQMIGLAKRPYIDVEACFNSGEVDTIVARLEVDVAIIAAIYFRLLLSKGRLTIESYRNIARATLRKYFERSPMAERYLEDSDVLNYFRAGHPTKK